MTEIYRLVRAERAEDVLSGEGARLYGGRWNPPGTAVVYASESRALAVLETFVHLTLEARSMRFQLWTIRLPSRPSVSRYRGSRAPRALAASQKAGAAWLVEEEALALLVPSVIVPQELNYVLNVRHSLFARLAVGEPEAFSFDQRLWRR